MLSAPSSGDRRVALVAYVGDDSEAFLPNPSGLRIICSLSPGGTSADALENLKLRGAVVEQAHRLHMKVYWSSRKGCVIGSANVTQNALGANGLKEAGVYVAPGDVDIDRLIAEASPQPVRDEHLKSLRRESGNLWLRTEGSVGFKGAPKSFLEWYASSSGDHWKLGWWESHCPVARAAKAVVKNQYGVAEPDDYINFARGQVKPCDWLLTFRLPKSPSFFWLYTDFTVKVPRSDRGAYESAAPNQAVQVHERSKYPTPPFRANDRTFQAAFRGALAKFGEERLTKSASLIPPKRLLDSIKAHMEKH